VRRAHSGCARGVGTRTHCGRVSSKRQSSTAQPARDASGQVLRFNQRAVQEVFPYSPNAHFRRCAVCRYNGAWARNDGIDVYWAAAVPFAWRVLLALDTSACRTRAISCNSRAGAKSPRCSRSITRAGARSEGRRLRLLRALAVLYTSTSNTRTAHLRPHAGGAGTISASSARPGLHRAACDRYRETPCFPRGADLRGMRSPRPSTRLRRARTIEARLSKSDWVVGESFSAVDMVIFPRIQLLRQLRS